MCTFFFFSQLVGSHWDIVKWITIKVVSSSCLTPTIKAELNKRMEVVLELINLLPQHNEIENIVQNKPEAKYMLKNSLDSLQAFALKKREDEIEESYFLVQALVDKCWEEIHTGHFSEVPVETRKIYALGCYCKVNKIIQSFGNCFVNLIIKRFYSFS